MRRAARARARTSTPRSDRRVIAVGGSRPPCSPLACGVPAGAPFVPPEALERRIGAPLELRIGANESAFGPSPKAVAAMAAAAERINWYCDPEGFVLREALARRHGVKLQNIVLGSGIDD